MGAKHNKEQKKKIQPHVVEETEGGEEVSSEEYVSLAPVLENMLILFWSEDSPYRAERVPDLVRRIWSLVLRLSPVLKRPRVRKVLRYDDKAELFSSTIQLRDDWNRTILGLKDSKPFTWTDIWHESDRPHKLIGGPYAVTCPRWRVTFPEPTGIKINMLPFKYHDKASLPEEYHGYWPLIEACAALQTTPHISYARGRDDEGPKSEIVYLTIDESVVSAGESQRRGGIHTDCPGTTVVDDGGLIQYRGAGHPWGVGGFTCGLDIRGGIFIASNTPDSCRAWNVSVVPEIIGPGGNCEHLRELIEEDMADQCHVLKADQLFWITDRTPHESLPVKAETHRQFFRLVTGPIGVWYTQHSTPNPLVVSLPHDVKILNNNKFSK